MLVASLLLILVAVTLLVLGLTGGSSLLLISSIVASLLAAIALVIGARQASAARRAATAPAGDAARPVDDPLRDAEYPVPVDAYTPPAADVESAGDFAPPPRSYARPAGQWAAPDEDYPPPPPPGGHAPVTGDYLPLYGDVDDGYAADGQEHPTGLDATQRVWPEADRDDVAAAGRPSSGRTSGPAAPEPAPQPAPQPAAAHHDVAAARTTGPAPAGTAPTEQFVPLDRSGSAGRSVPFGEAPAAGRDDAQEAGVPDEFDEPDPDDPDDEPLPQAVRPADAVRVARLDAEVLVVDGRPRYHLSDCPHLVGRLTEGLPVAEAVELGFSPCGLCRPVDRLVAAASRR